MKKKILNVSRTIWVIENKNISLPGALKEKIFIFFQKKHLQIGAGRVIIAHDKGVKKGAREVLKCVLLFFGTLFLFSRRCEN